MDEEQLQSPIRLALAQPTTQGSALCCVEGVKGVVARAREVQCKHLPGQQDQDPVLR